MVEGSVTVSIFVPLLVLVVVEISQSAREFELQRIARRKQEPFFYGTVFALDRLPQEYIPTPQLGPFNFIHGMNLGILYLGFTLTVTTATGRIRILTGLVLFVFWLLFPMIEVDEYVLIMDDPETSPMSFLYHSVLTTLVAAVIFLFGGNVRLPTELGNIQPGFVVFVLVVGGLYYACLIGYLDLLESELERADRLSLVRT